MTACIMARKSTGRCNTYHTDRDFDSNDSRQFVKETAATDDGADTGVDGDSTSEVADEETRRR